MNRELRKKLTVYNKRIQQNMVKVNNTKKATSPLTFTNYHTYNNRQYDRIYEAIVKYLMDNYEQTYFEERWKQIITAKRLNRNLRGIDFNRERDTHNVEQYIKGVLNDINNAITNGKKERYLNLRLVELRNKQNIQAFLEEEEIEDIINDAQNYPDARNMLIDRLSEYSDDGQTIAVETKTGKIIHYDIRYYTDMVLRTTLREIQTAATLDAANEVGTDLVQVSVHNTICPICIPFEGKIYSIDGKNPLFPPLDDTPPYHPNCLHSLTVVFESVLINRGNLDDYVKFSRGETDIHPTARGWIPPSQRNIA
jgi:hypothetical protein